MTRYQLLNKSGHVIATALGTTPQDIAQSFSRMCSAFENIRTGERYEIHHGNAINVTLIRAIEEANQYAARAA